MFQCLWKNCNYKTESQEKARYRSRNHKTQEAVTLPCLKIILGSPAEVLYGQQEQIAKHKRNCQICKEAELSGGRYRSHSKSDTDSKDVKGRKSRRRSRSGSRRRRRSRTRSSSRYPSLARRRRKSRIRSRSTSNSRSRSWSNTRRTKKRSNRRRRSQIALGQNRTQDLEVGQRQGKLKRGATSVRSTNI